MNKPIKTTKTSSTSIIIDTDILNKIVYIHDRITETEDAKVTYTIINDSICIKVEQLAGVVIAGIDISISLLELKFSKLPIESLFEAFILPKLILLDKTIRQYENAPTMHSEA